MTREFIGEVLAPYPRSDAVRKVLRRLEELGEVGYREAWETVWLETVRLIGVQEGAGLASVTYPGIEWHDLLRPFIEAWRGVYPDGLARWFDNNFFYRVPVFHELPDAKRLILPGLVHSIKSLVSKPIRVYTPGPLTMTKLSETRDVDRAALAERIAELLRKELEAAVKAGASIVEIHEPILGDIDATEEDAAEAVRLLERLLEGLRCEKRLVVYYSPPKPEVAKRLADAPVDTIVIDYVDNPDVASEALRILSKNLESLGAGLVDARSIYPEDPQVIASKARSLGDALGAKRFAVYTSAPLDLIPLRHAVEKTRIVGLSSLLAQRA